jgi:hypothetical protein
MTRTIHHWPFLPSSSPLPPAGLNEPLEMSESPGKKFATIYRGELKTVLFRIRE